MSSPDAIAVVVVTYRSSEHLPAFSAALVPQLRDDDELVVVDNASGDETAELAAGLHERIRVIETGENLGFAGGCHAGASGTRSPLLLFLNPDSEPHPDCLDQLRKAARAHPGWGAWQAAVMLDDEHINTSGEIVHYLGIGWAGECGRPASALPSHDREVAAPSGAAMMVRRSDWLALGGMKQEYFMYSEDLDFGLRLWLSGRGVGLVPGARVNHNYDFEKGSYKWFWMERNRWRTVLSVYPAPLLALLAPALLAAEIGLLVIAARQGWLMPKLRAQVAVLGDLPTSLRRRREAQAHRRVSATQFGARLTSSLDSPYLDAAQHPFLRVPQALYWSLAQRALAILER